MDRKQIEQSLIDAIYLHYRREYAQVKYYVEKDNGLEGLSTISAEEYVFNNMQKLIHYFNDRG